MKLNDRLITEVVYRGKRYRLKPWVRNVLDAIDALHDDGISPEDGIDVALRCLVPGRVPRKAVDKHALLEAIFTAFNGSDEKPKAEKPSISLAQDAALIVAAFRQAYGIDLQRDPLHWNTFQALLAAIPSDTRLGEVISLRNRPIPKPTKDNAEERAALMKAQAAVAITTTDQERKHALDGDLRTLAGAFSMMARK